MEPFNNLLFELSGVDRLDILMLLKKNPLKLSYISRKLDLTVQETSRNITRLIEAKLIVKDVDGAFHLTLYGEEALTQLSGFKFLFHNRDYFLTHMLNALPKQFQSSIGMLEGAEFVDDVMIAFRNVEEMIAKAQERVWILTNQVLASTIPYLTQAIERGAEFKLLMPKDYLPTNSIREVISDPVFEKAARIKKLDMRFLGKLGAFVCVSEKEVAAIGFPSIEGKFDYTGFKGKTDSVIEWTNGLFMYCWNEASTQIPDQIFSP